MVSSLSPAVRAVAECGVRLGTVAGLLSRESTADLATVALGLGKIGDDALSLLGDVRAELARRECGGTNGKA